MFTAVVFAFGAVFGRRKKIAATTATTNNAATIATAIH